LHPDIYAFTLRSLKYRGKTSFLSPSPFIFPLSSLHGFDFHFNTMQHYLTLSFSAFTLLFPRLFPAVSHYRAWLNAFHKENENCLKSNALSMECRAEPLA